MTTQYEGASAEQRYEIGRRDALIGNINYLLFSQSAILELLNGRKEDGQQAIIKILGGSLKLAERVRHAEIGLVNVSYLDLTTGESTTESTTISIDKRHYKLEGYEVQVIDEYQEDPSEDEDVLQTMFDVVTPLRDGVTVRWDHSLSRWKALEQLEIHPDWYR
jgi:hypothetical protein